MLGIFSFLDFRNVNGCGARYTPLKTLLVHPSPLPLTSLLAAPLAPALLKPLPHPTSLRFVDSLAGGIAAASHGGTTLVCGAWPE